jgi:hypothetical protein
MHHWFFIMFGMSSAWCAELAHPVFERVPPGMQCVGRGRKVAG